MAARNAATGPNTHGGYVNTKQRILGLLTLLLLLAGMAAPMADAAKPKRDRGDNQERVWGGNDNSQSGIYHVVSIGTNNPYTTDKARRNHRCSGTLLTRTKVLSAAHCFSGTDVQNPTTLRVRASVGSWADMDAGLGQTRTVSSIVKHGLYVNGSFDYDVAILTVSTAFPAEYLALKWPVIGSGQTQHYAEGGDYYLYGWGQDEGAYASDPNQSASSTGLRTATLTGKSDTALAASMGTSFKSNLMFGAGGMYPQKNACIGDSGAPLTALIQPETGLSYEAIVGVVSHGEKRQCPYLDGEATIFTKLAQSNIRQFILNFAGV